MIETFFGNIKRVRDIHLDPVPAEDIARVLNYGFQNHHISEEDVIKAAKKLKVKQVKRDQYAKTDAVRVATEVCNIIKVEHEKRLKKYNEKAKAESDLREMVENCRFQEALRSEPMPAASLLWDGGAA